MSDKNDALPEQRFGPLLRGADQGCAGALLGLSLLAMAGYWLLLGGHRGELIDIERAPQQTIKFQIDLNQADWPELTLLPGIGETLAKRIVESRESQGPYLDHDDLTRVRGIGPKTLARVKPYLLPMPDFENVAGQ